MCLGDARIATCRSLNTQRGFSGQAIFQCGRHLRCCVHPVYTVPIMRAKRVLALPGTVARSAQRDVTPAANNRAPRSRYHEPAVVVHAANNVHVTTKKYYSSPGRGTVRSPTTASSLSTLSLGSTASPGGSPPPRSRSPPPTAQTLTARALTARVSTPRTAVNLTPRARSPTSDEQQEPYFSPPYPSLSDPVANYRELSPLSNEIFDVPAPNPLFTFSQSQAKKKRSRLEKEGANQTLVKKAYEVPLFKRYPTTYVDVIRKRSPRAEGGGMGRVYDTFDPPVSPRPLPGQRKRLKHVRSRVMDHLPSSPRRTDDESITLRNTRLCYPEKKDARHECGDYLNLAQHVRKMDTERRRLLRLHRIAEIGDTRTRTEVARGVHLRLQARKEAHEALQDASRYLKELDKMLDPMDEEREHIDRKIAVAEQRLIIADEMDHIDHAIEMGKCAEDQFQVTRKPYPEFGNVKFTPSTTPRVTYGAEKRLDVLPYEPRKTFSTPERLARGESGEKMTKRKIATKGNNESANEDWSGMDDEDALEWHDAWRLTGKGMRTHATSQVSHRGLLSRTSADSDESEDSNAPYQSRKNISAAVRQPRDGRSPSGAEIYKQQAGEAKRTARQLGHINRPEKSRGADISPRSRKADEVTHQRDVAESPEEHTRPSFSQREARGAHKNDQQGSIHQQQSSRSRSSIARKHAIKQTEQRGSDATDESLIARLSDIVFCASRGLNTDKQRSTQSSAASKDSVYGRRKSMSSTADGENVYEQQLAERRAAKQKSSAALEDNMYQQRKPEALPFDADTEYQQKLKERKATERKSPSGKVYERRTSESLGADVDNVCQQQLTNRKAAEQTLRAATKDNVYGRGKSKPLTVDVDNVYQQLTDRKAAERTSRAATRDNIYGGGKPKPLAAGVENVHHQQLTERDEAERKSPAATKDNIYGRGKSKPLTVRVGNVYRQNLAERKAAERKPATENKMYKQRKPESLTADGENVYKQKLTEREAARRKSPAATEDNVYMQRKSESFTAGVENVYKQQLTERKATERKALVTTEDNVYEQRKSESLTAGVDNVNKQQLTERKAPERTTPTEDNVYRRRKSESWTADADARYRQQLLESRALP